MTDLEQKAREVRKQVLNELADIIERGKPDAQEIADKVQDTIAAAIQSAVSEERLENRKLFSIGMSDLRREPNYDRICDKVSQIDEAIRARAKAKEKLKLNQR